MSNPAPHPEIPRRRNFRLPVGLPVSSMLPLWRRVHQEFMLRSQKWDLPTNASMVLVHLHLHPEDSEPATVAASNYFPRQTVTFILDLLEKKGLAVRRPHPKDRRRKLVQLTLKGKKKADAMFQDMVRFESAALKTIADVNIPHLQSFLANYANALAAQNDRDLKI